MGSLVDIAAKNPTVTIRETDIEITGIGAEGLATLFVRFPEVVDLFEGKGVTLTPELLAKGGPDFVKAFIACGTGHTAEKDHETAAGKLTVVEQFNLIEAIFKRTFPDVGEFIARLRAAATAAKLVSSKVSPKPLNS